MLRATWGQNIYSSNYPAIYISTYYFNSAQVMKVDRAPDTNMFLPIAPASLQQPGDHGRMSSLSNQQLSINWHGQLHVGSKYRHGSGIWWWILTWNHTKSSEGRKCYSYVKADIVAEGSNRRMEFFVLVLLKVY